MDVGVEKINRNVNNMDFTNLSLEPTTTPVFPNMQVMKWPFPIADVPVSLAADGGYMVAPNSLEVLADADLMFSSQFDDDPILQAVLFKIGEGVENVGNDVFRSAKSTLNRALITRARYAMALYMAFLLKLRKAQKNDEEGTFASIEIDRWTVQDEIENSRNILSKYKDIMSSNLDELVGCLSPSLFEAAVNEIVGKMMKYNNDESDSSTIDSVDDCESNF